MHLITKQKNIYDDANLCMIVNVGFGMCLFFFF